MRVFAANVSFEASGITLLHFSALYDFHEHSGVVELLDLKAASHYTNYGGCRWLVPESLSSSRVLSELRF